MHKPRSEPGFHWSTRSAGWRTRVRYHVQVPLTFLNMTSEMTAEAVNRAAMIIIMIPTGMFLLSPVREEIQPLWNRKMRLGKWANVPLETTTGTQGSFHGITFLGSRRTPLIPQIRDDIRPSGPGHTPEKDQPGLTGKPHSWAPRGAWRPNRLQLLEEI